MNAVYFANNMDILRVLPDKSINLIYIDPPFNTGKKQLLHDNSFNDTFGNHENYIKFIRERLYEAYRILAPNGSLYFHIDYRESHYCKVLLDCIFGIHSFMNEIIWAYDYGGRSKTKWSPKHDTILYYVKDPNNYVFNYENIDRIEYMAPGLVGEEKAKRGKAVTDTWCDYGTFWWHTIVHTNGKERTGYPTQKPLAILKRIIAVSSNPNDVVLDFFAGSGTTGAACLELGRRFILIDNNIDAINIMKKRFENQNVTFY